MVLFVVTTYTTDWYGWELDLIAQTDLPCHLYLSWLPTYPPALPKYKTRQGRTYQCGWSFNWAGALVAEQLEPGPTTTHTFNLDGLTSRGDSWWALSECGPPATACASTPPIPIVNNALAEFVVGAHDPGPIAPGATYTPLWDELQGAGHWPTPPLPFTAWTAPTTGQAFLICGVGFNTGAPATAELTLTDLTTATAIVDQFLPYDPASGYPILFATGHLVKGHIYQFTATNLGPDPAALDQPFGNNRTAIGLALQPSA